MTDRLKGLLITTLGMLLIVPDSLMVRLIDNDATVTAFWRNAVAGSIILAGVIAFQGPRTFPRILALGWPVWIYVVLLGSTGLAFVLAVENTSVANVVFIFAAIPVFAAILSRVFLGERITRRLVWTMLAVGIGLGIIALGSQSSRIASWTGDLWALYVAFAFAAALTAVRRLRGVSLIPAIPVAYGGLAAMLWFTTDPMAGFYDRWPLYFIHGTLIACGSCLLTLGPRYISAPEVSLLVLLESVLAPLLVWAVIGENPGRLAVIGGAMVVGALVISNLVALHRART